MRFKAWTSYYIRVDRDPADPNVDWFAALAIPIWDNKVGFHTPYGLVKEDNPRLQVLGEVPKPPASLLLRWISPRKLAAAPIEEEYNPEPPAA